MDKDYDFAPDTIGKEMCLEVMLTYPQEYGESY